MNESFVNIITINKIISNTGNNQITITLIIDHNSSNAVGPSLIMITITTNFY